MADDWPPYAVAHSPDGRQQKTHITRPRYSVERHRARCGMVLQDRDTPRWVAPQDEDLCRRCQKEVTDG